MGEEIRALNILISHIETEFGSDDYYKVKSARDAIEKKLEAFEVIKEKKVNVGALLKLFAHERGLEIYNSNCKEELTQENYNLLKETLNEIDTNID